MEKLGRGKKKQPYFTIQRKLLCFDFFPLMVLCLQSWDLNDGFIFCTDFLFHLIFYHEYVLVLLKILYKVGLKLLYAVAWDEYCIIEISSFIAWHFGILFINLLFDIINNVVVNTFLYGHTFLPNLHFSFWIEDVDFVFVPLSYN